MWEAQGRGRQAIALGVVLACVVLAWCPCAFALDPALDVSQYAHTAWRIREGFAKGQITSIAQTPDGYLWLGTEFGLVRFDGVRTVPWPAPSGQRLPSSYVASLLAVGNGTLWIGTMKGLARWRDGKLNQYPELQGMAVGALVEDSEGTVWAGALSATGGRLCAFQAGGVQCWGEDRSLGAGVVGLYLDSQRRLWVGVVEGLWRWKPGPPIFYPLPTETNGIRAIAEDDAGALLIGMRGGIRRFVDGKTEVASRFPGAL